MLTAAVLCIAARTSAADEPASTSSAPPDVGDEVIVTGKTRAAIQAALIRAEDRMYEIYNSINASDDFDIHCREQRRYHSRILERVCEPSFVHHDDEHIARAALEGVRGEMGPNSQEFVAEEHSKAAALRKDWEGLLHDHPELLGAQMRVEALLKAVNEPASLSHGKRSEHDVHR